MPYQTCVHEIRNTHPVSHVCNTDVSMRMSLLSDAISDDHMKGMVNVEVSTDINDDDIVVRDSHDVNMTYRFDSSKYTVKERIFEDLCTGPQKVVVDKLDRAVWEQMNVRVCDTGSDKALREDIIGRLINSGFFHEGICARLSADSNDCWRALPSHRHHQGHRFKPHPQMM